MFFKAMENHSVYTRVRGTVCLTVAIFIGMSFSGCNFMAGSKSKSESLQTAEKLTAQQEQTFRRVAVGTHGQSPQLEIKGKNNTVSYNYPPNPIIPPNEEVEFASASGQDAGTNTTWLTKSKWSIPIGVSLILLGVGVFVVLWAMKAARNSSLAVDAAFKVADTALADLASKTGAKMAMSTNASDNASHAVEMAQVEKARRKLKNEVYP